MRQQRIENVLCVYVIMKKENQILCVQNVLIVELFIDIKIICEMSHVC